MTNARAFEPEPELLGLQVGENRSLNGIYPVGSAHTVQCPSTSRAQPEARRTPGRTRERSREVAHGTGDLCHAERAQMCRSGRRFGSDGAIAMCALSFGFAEAERAASQSVDLLGNKAKAELVGHSFRLVK